MSDDLQLTEKGHKLIQTKENEKVKALAQDSSKIKSKNAEK